PGRWRSSEEEVALPFFEAELEAGPGKTWKSRSQRKREKFRHAVVSKGEPGPENTLGYKIPQDIVQLQKNDNLVGPLYKWVEERSRAGQPEVESSQGVFCLRNGVLFRKRSPEPQLVVPREGRELVLSLGHSVPWAGHLGRHKTTARIVRHFYWPGMRKDIATYCKTCPQCQQTSLRVPPRAPLKPLPIIGVPFEQLGMDIVGPLEKTKTGNRYMLVITDYATRYPEVFPLKSIKARVVASALIQLFSRVGFPKSIVTDQGSNFMSELLKQVYKLLGIKGVRTTPYH
uniref:Gypsy retrotransposon integrase-like protein 1 n=1 Tax=Cyprinus carpio TaxID=7962 RepID=A0A8C2GBZ0_CYPCA